MGTTPNPDFPRDDDGQPLILPPGATQRSAYMRVTNLIDVLDPRYGLEWWGHRQVIVGLAKDFLDENADPNEPTLWSQAKKWVADPHEDEDRQKKRLNSLVYRAWAATKTEDRAANGTRIHALTEAYDRGTPLPEDASESDLRDLAAYIDAMGQLGARCVEIERRVVIDEFRAAGTLDRALDVQLPGFARRITCVADIKTGQIQYGNGKLAMQLGAYALGEGYDAGNEANRVHLGLDRATGLLIHLPQGEGRCDIYLVDLKRGIAWLRLARAVNDYREVSGDARADDALFHGEATDESVAELRGLIENQQSRRAIAAAEPAEETPAKQAA